MNNMFDNKVMKKIQYDRIDIKVEKYSIEIVFSIKYEK